ncbi:hypothetical protein ACCUM_2487 [Candidatus Accumulibacter phosphatis]|uniref:Uncharacterized protein n=1 Tax=Candidatus Accumulibacter phosphatis TaxID=327160 RepID=A0A5S4F2G7_9PROT|nr:hypothetical protein ACCUM_2487 [Candidatus Accumulibacter phosphatis]
MMRSFSVVSNDEANGGCGRTTVQASATMSLMLPPVVSCRDTFQEMPP